MNEPHNPYFRFLVGMVGTAVALHIAWLLIRPVLPAIAVVVAMAAIWRVWRWHRERW